MRIIYDKQDSRPRFNKIEIGDVFCHGGEIFVKIAESIGKDSRAVNCLSLNYFGLSFFDNDAKVEKLDSELILR